MAAAIADALQQSVSRITALSESSLREDGPEVFEGFRRAVTQAARGREAQLLGGLADKEAVLRFLVNFHEVKRTHRRQIVAVMTVLMHEKPWHRALCEAEGLRARLPEDLEACVAEGPAEEESAEEAQEEQPEGPSLGEEQEAPTARRSSRVVRSVGSLADATAKLQQLGFCAVDTDAAIDAFAVLNRSVLWVVQSPETEDDEVLSGLEEKEKVLEFLADFHDRKPKHRARVTGLCVRLMEYETWREAVLATSPSVAATISGMTGLPVTTPEAVAVNLATAAEVAASRGALGAVYIRIVRAKKLPTTGAQHPTPFVRVTVGDRAQRTESCDEAVAIWQRRDGGSLQRHRECRLRLIKASHGFRTACSSAAFELWDLKSSGSFQGGESSLEVLSKESESCRLALQMKARMVTLGLSPLSMELFFSGVTGEAMRDCCFMAAKALRHASARLLELGGRPPPGQVPAAPWLTSPNVTAEDCQVAAAECRDMLTRYKDVWSSMYLDDAPHSWKARLEESVTLGITNGKPKEEFFLDGSYHLRTVLEAQHQEEALVAAFDEASRNAASLVGVCTAAESAATLAELVATASPKAPRCGCAAPRVTGIQHWLSAPFAGLKAWQKGFAKGKSFAFRVSFAILLTSLLKDLIPVNSLWPSKDGSSWTLFTIALITTPVQGATLLRGMRRGLGTVVGSVLAVASVALLGAAPTFRALWCQVFVMAFGLKFFEPEMQYAGAVTFVTYQIVLSSLADKLIEDNELVLPMPKAVDIAVRRCVDVLVGIVVATVVSIFLAPDRGIDELRDRENEALKCAVTALRRAGAVLAATAAGQPRDATEDEEAWTELRNEVWTSFEALNFAGDGQPGVGDVLEDARWEGRWGVDGGFLVLGGLLWLPRCCFRCCGRRKKPSSRKCLQAVVAISRLLRIVNMLVAMLQEGLGEDAGLPLANDPRVLQALGTNGEALAESLDAALGVASAMLTGQSGGKVEPVMADLEERNRLLLLGAGASRKKAGGLARNQNLGGLRAAAAIKLLDISLRALGESLRSLEGHRAEHSTASKNASSDRSTSPSSLSAEPSHEESTEQIDLEEGQIRV